MATVYGAVITVALGSVNGQRKPFGYTASDVTTELWLSPSGASTITFAGQDAYVVDVLVSSSGGTCKNAIFYVAGQEVIRHNIANLTGSVVNRPFNICPLRIPAGQGLLVTQLT